MNQQIENKNLLASKMLVVCQFIFPFLAGLLLLPVALIVMPILLFMAWLKRNEPIKLKRHQIERLKEIHEAKQKFYGNK